MSDDAEHLWHSELVERSPLTCRVAKVWESSKGNQIAKLYIHGDEYIHSIENHETRASLERAAKYGRPVRLTADGMKGDARIEWDEADAETEGTGPGKPDAPAPDPFDPREPSPQSLSQGQEMLNALNLAADVMEEFRRAHGGRMPTEEERKLAVTLYINGG